VIKNKILAAGRISHMSLLLRCVLSVVAPCNVVDGSTDFLDSLNAYGEESEWVSELKSTSSSSRLPYGTLALGAEGIKMEIKSFDDTCVSIFPFPFPDLMVES
jgi:hypothetical protein